MTTSTFISCVKCGCRLINGVCTNYECFIGIMPPPVPNVTKEEWEMCTSTLKAQNEKGWGAPPIPKAKTDKVGSGLVLVPFYSILKLGSIFIEGLRYGRDNWKKGVNDKEYQEERLEHAFLHLIKWKEGDRSEEHLAKVMWFCATQLELERLENEQV